MLGWEYPPLFSGGLGIATQGIVKSLRHRASVTLILPSGGEALDLSNVRVIGLHCISQEEVDLDAVADSLLGYAAAIHRLPLGLSPYQFENEALWSRGSWQSRGIESAGQRLEAVHSIFADANPYGGDFHRKVQLYTLLVTQLASRIDFDIIHAHDWITFAAGLIIRERSGKPLVVHVHSLETDRAGAHTRNQIYSIERDALNQADAIVAVSQYTKLQMCRHYGIPPTRIDVVHNGIDPAVKPRSNHVLRDKYVVFLGRLTYQKGPEFLLETAEKVVRVFPRVKFVVAGTGDEFAHLLETSAYKKLGNKFIFAGFLSKQRVDDLLSVADVYFMPSVSEPFGITALEAVQHQVPTVLSSQSGAAEVIQASLHADFWDTDKYANYIHALLRYHKLGKVLSDQASAGLATLTWDHTAEKLTDLYKRVTHQHKQ
jgi:glycosyltransferase involved in cell wall biosynthesis